MKRTYLFLRYGALLSTILLLTNCTFKDDINELKDSIDDFTVYLTTPAFDTGVHFEFVDARTNEIIDNKEVTVTVSGEDAALIYNNIGSKQETYTSNWGTLDLIVDPHKADSASLATKPVQFTVTASLAGYTTETQAVSIYDKSMQTVRIFLINKNNPPEGVLFAETEVAVTTTADGKLTQDLTFEVGGGAAQTIAQRLKGAVVSGGFTLTIPAGTQFIGALGERITTPVRSLNVSTQFTQLYFDEDWYLGLQPSTQTSQGQFTSLASVRLELEAVLDMFDNEKRIISNLSNLGQLDIEMQIAQAFQQTPIFQYNPVTGVTSKVNSRYEMNYLSISSHFQKVDNPLIFGHLQPYCDNASRRLYVEFEFPDPKATGSGNIVSELISTSSNTQIAKVNTSFSGRPFILKQFTSKVPQGAGKIVFSAPGNLKFTPESITINDLCTSGSYKVKVEKATPPSGQNWINLNIDVSVTAQSNSNFVIKPTLTLYYGTTDFSPVNLTNGKASLQITEGTLYKIRGALGSTQAQGTFKVESESATSYKLTFTEQLTSGGSGAVTSISVPKTAANEVTLKYVFPVTDDVLNNFK